jgi:hypothetical protein
MDPDAALVAAPGLAWIHFFSVKCTSMAAARRRVQASLEKANQSREHDCQDEVSAGRPVPEDAAAIERQTRERLAEYFAILREWDLRLRHNESKDVPEFRPS